MTFFKKYSLGFAREEVLFIFVTEIPADSPVYATENNDCWQSQGPPSGLFTFETFEINSV